MEKRICKACRVEFAPKVHNQVYCSDCGKHPKQASIFYRQRQKAYDEILGKRTEYHEPYMS